VVPEGVVHALETVHSTLRPNGYFLDIRPAQQQPWLEISRAEKCTRLGHIDDAYRMGTLAMADSALETVIEAGLFEREEEITFPFIYHCGEVGAWLAYMTSHWSSATVDAILIERAREALREDTGDLRILRIIHAARLRRAWFARDHGYAGAQQDQSDDEHICSRHSRVAARGG
jgi:hypothetical protein